MGQHLQVILTEDVNNLGNAGDIVRVKAGYARNFLLPRKQAVLATRSKVNEIEHHKQVIAAKVARLHKELVHFRDKIQGLDLTIAAQAGEEGKLFGSVTATAIAELISEKLNVPVDRRKVALEDPIKEVGEHKVAIRLGKDVVAKVVVKVVAAA